MGCLSLHEGKEASMADQSSSALALLTEFLSAGHIEAVACQTGFVYRVSKITGKIFLALVTFRV